MQDLRVTTIQTRQAWEDQEANLEHFDRLVKSTDQTDVIILPEMWSTGFSMNAAALAEGTEGPAFRKMKEWAVAREALVLGSVIVEEENYFNRLYAVTPEGFQHYDKRHLFRMANEHHTYDYGRESIIVRWKGWNIMPLVCYDLRFPVWSRNKTTKDGALYDLLVFVANWPAARVAAWDTLLKARAIENYTYCAGVNRMGKDGNGIEYNGHTAVYGPKGDTLYFSMEEAVEQTLLNYSDLEAYRTKFPVHLDSDNFNITET